MRIKKSIDSNNESKPQNDAKSKVKCDWIIHMVANGAKCADCGKVEQGFIPYACNAHTHGMTLYNHKEFQVVLQYPPREIMYILNSMGFRVQAGERFKSGDIIHGIYEDCDVKLAEFMDNDRSVLRIIIPDKYGRFPDDPQCMEQYKHQLLPTEELYIGNHNE